MKHGGIFMHDIDPKHIVQATKEWLGKRFQGSGVVSGPQPNPICTRYIHIQYMSHFLLEQWAIVYMKLRRTFELTKYWIIYVSFHSQLMHMMDITDLSYLFKWEDLQNQ